jgi:hypothetical protein
VEGWVERWVGAAPLMPVGVAHSSRRYARAHSRTTTRCLMPATVVLTGKDMARVLPRTSFKKKLTDSACIPTHFPVVGPKVLGG